MANVKIQGNVSGTGSLTIAAPNTNSDRTLTLPDESGTLLSSASPVIAQNGVPAFSASLATNQNVTSNTITKVQLTVEQFDTAGAFDNVTNYRFQPTVAGYYQFSAAVNGSADAGSLQAVNAQIYKNGSELIATYLTGAFVYPTSVNSACSTGSILTYMNGSTDYVELYGKVIGTSPYFGGAYLTGVLVRAA